MILAILCNKLINTPSCLPYISVIDQNYHFHVRKSSNAGTKSTEVIHKSMSIFAYHDVIIITNFFKVFDIYEKSGKHEYLCSVVPRTILLAVTTLFIALLLLQNIK